MRPASSSEIALRETPTCSASSACVRCSRSRCERTILPSAAASDGMDSKLTACRLTDSGSTVRQYTVMMLPSTRLLAIAADHVRAASATDALLYIAAVLLWLAGIVAMIVRKVGSA